MKKLKKVKLSNQVSLSLYGDRIEVKNGTDNLVFLFDEIGAVTVLGRNKLNIYHGGKIYQVKSGKRFNALKSQFDESIKGFMDTGLIDITGNEQQAYNDVLDGIRNNTIKTVDQCKEEFAKLANLNYEELTAKLAQKQDQDASYGIAKTGSAASEADGKV